MVWIRQIKNSMNRGEGRYRFAHLYDDLLKGHRRRGRGAHTGLRSLRTMTNLPPYSDSILKKSVNGIIVHLPYGPLARVVNVVKSY